MERLQWKLRDTHKVGISGLDFCLAVGHFKDGFQICEMSNTPGEEVLGEGELGES